jgi:hypothetical protein
MIKSKKYKIADSYIYIFLVWIIWMAYAYIVNVAILVRAALNDVGMTPNIQFSYSYQSSRNNNNNNNMIQHFF